MTRTEEGHSPPGGTGTGPALPDGTGAGKKLSGGGDDSRSRILAAAVRHFAERGYQGARTQGIADEAGVNKAMIYYHFRGKEHLYEEALSGPFRMVAGQILPLLAREDLPARERLMGVVEGYQRFLSENPHVRDMVLRELAGGGRHLPALLEHVRLSVPGFDVTHAFDAVDRMIERGELRSGDPRQMVLSLLALTIFPFMARPMLELLWGLPEGGFAGFLAERPAAISRLLEHGLLVTAETSS